MNSASARYADAQQRIQPYLDHLGVPYSILDLATTELGPEVANHALIVIGHASIDPTGQYLSAGEQSTLEAAVRGGCGLVNFDFDLATSSRTARYQFVTDLFGFGYGWNTSGEGILFPSGAPSQWVTNRHSAGEIVWARQMPAASVIPGPGATVLARYWDSNDPFLVATAYGQGRAVQFTSYEWMSRSIRGPLRGLDDLVWRSLAWAARKPFVMQGLPNFLTMRVDDVIGGFWWVQIANDLQLKPWLGLFYKSISEANAADLAALTAAGQATASVHGDAPGFFYYDHFAQAPFSDATLAAYFQDATDWHQQRGIPISSLVVPHFYEIGPNAFPWLQTWGVRSVATHMTPGEPYGAPWLMLKPFRVYEAGASDDAAPVAYADYVTVPGHPELSGQFFNCLTEIRDDAGYEWYPDATDVPGTVGRGTRQLRRALDSMALATLFTHEPYIQSFAPTDWRTSLQTILGNVAGYTPVYVTLDEACEYLRAKHDSRIASSVFDPVTQVLTTVVTGRTDVATQFMVFTEQSGEVQQAWAGIPAFSGSTQITRQLAPGTTPILEAITVAPASATLQTGATVQLRATGSYSDGSLQDLTALVAWASSSPAAATVGAGGLATAVSAGTATFTATYGGLTGSSTLTVTPALSSIAVTPASPALLAGATLQLVATGTYADGSTRDLTTLVSWASSAPAVATVDASGLATALASGTATLSATVSGVTGSTVLTVTAPALTSIAVAPATATVTAGGAQQFTATGTYADGSSRELTAQAAWTSSSPAVATVSATGLATAVSAGSATIGATLAGVSGQATLTVQPAPLAVTTSSLPSGQRDQAYSAALQATGGTPPYAWTVTAGALPPGLALAASGAISGTPTASGTFAFTATVTDAAMATAGAALSIAVAAPPAGGVSIWPAGAAPATADRGADSSIELGVKFRSDVAGQVTGIRFYKSGANTGTHVGNLWSGTGQRLATATFTNETSSGWQQVTFATPVPIAANTTYVASYHAPVGHYARDLNYFSTSGYDNPPLHALPNATSGGNGVFAYGATSAFPSDAALAANYWVDVVFTTGSAPTLTSIAITPASPAVPAGGTQQFTAIGTYSDGSTQDLGGQATWTSSNTSIATVAAGGLASALSPGTATISATQSGVTGTATLSVTAPTLSSIAVTPIGASVAAGGTQQFTATGTYSNGSSVDLTTQVTWASSNTAAATISPYGLATTVAAGTTAISATLSGITGSTTFTVTP
ncbi:Ig-like domain-containing protein, partial [Anaeromyxobacter sp. PSR-1]|uniref:Ig-like domain-containing protein n=1 Tax=Anaeromyxobacter sp. PSR-1 TaxID=1300915 RepID=UPI0007510DD8